MLATGHRCFQDPNVGVCASPGCNITSHPDCRTERLPCCMGGRTPSCVSRARRDAESSPSPLQHRALGTPLCFDSSPGSLVRGETSQHLLPSRSQYSDSIFSAAWGNSTPSGDSAPHGSLASQTIEACSVHPDLRKRACGLGLETLLPIQPSSPVFITRAGPAN